MTRSKAATLGQFFVGGVQYFAVAAFRTGSEQVSEVSERGVFHFWWNDATRQLSHQVHLDLWGRRAQAVYFVHDGAIFRHSE